MTEKVGTGEVYLQHRSGRGRLQVDQFIFMWKSVVLDRADNPTRSEIFAGLEEEKGGVLG